MTRKYLLDLAERVAATYVEAVCTFVILGWNVEAIGDWSVVEYGLWSAVPAGLAVLKGGLARFRGDRENPSLVAPPIRTTLER